MVVEYSIKYYIKDWKIIRRNNVSISKNILKINNIT